MWRYISILVLLLATTSCNAANYYGTVVEIGAHYNDTENTTEHILKMTDQCIEIINSVKNKTEIIVFPEYFLTSTRIFNSSSLNLSTPVPDAKDKKAPCDQKLNDSNPLSLALQNFSCAARENKVYVVINLLESEVSKANKSEVLIYNTNVVFDRNGTVIAKYRKYHLFGEPGVSVTKEPELVTFTTDFGVTFATFICFDILFFEPSLRLLKESNVTDIVYSAAWISEPPFLTALQVQAGWARANGVNLLAAGYHDTQRGHWGSGQYSAKTGFTVINNLFAEPLEVTSTSTFLLPILRSRVPQNQDAREYSIISSTTNDTTYYLMNDTNFNKYNATDLTKPVVDREYCHGNFCCTFSVEYEKLTYINNYKVVVYNGTRYFNTQKVHIQLCALVACLQNECGQFKFNYTIPNSFTSIRINGKFHNGNTTTQFPTTLLNKMLVPMSYTSYLYNATEKKGDTEISMSLKKEQNDILAFGIYNTISKYMVEPNSSSSIIASNILALISLLIVKFYS